MAKPDTAKIDSLEAILAEKRKHETYLAKLEERRGQVPSHVFNKLRDEYLTKLTDLQVRASLEAESLGESLRVDESAVTDVDQRLTAAIEQRLEGELRAEVGEYDPKDWEKKRTALEASIAQLENEKQVKVAAFERTRTLLSEARGAAAALSTSTAPEPEPPSAPMPPDLPLLAPAAPVAAAPAAPVPGRASAPAGVPPVPPARATPAGLPVPPARATPAGLPVPPSPAPPPPRTAAASSAPEPSAPIVEAPSASPKPAAPMVGSPSFDELAFLNSVVGRVSMPQKQEDAPSPRPSGAVPQPPQPPARGTTNVKSADVEPNSAPSGPLGRPTPRTSQAIKTLKCQECGTLNYPTEWYCERCGGELAAL